MTEDFTNLCKRLEHFETPEWAARAILDKEALSGIVIDPCCGLGILAETARQAGYPTYANDINNWGYAAQAGHENFLEIEGILILGDFSIFMNPPFFLACPFVEKSLELGAHKIICFQRFAWWESRKRRDFWRAHPPRTHGLSGSAGTREIRR